MYIIIVLVLRGEKLSIPFCRALSDSVARERHRRITTVCTVLCVLVQRAATPCGRCHGVCGPFPLGLSSELKNKGCMSMLFGGCRSRCTSPRLQRTLVRLRKLGFSLLVLLVVGALFCFSLAHTLPLQDSLTHLLLYPHMYQASILWFKKSMIMIPIKKQAFLQIGRLTHAAGGSSVATGTATDKVTSGSKQLFFHRGGLTKGESLYDT